MEYALKIQCVLPAFSMRFQREFDRYNNVSDRVLSYSDYLGYVRLSVIFLVLYFFKSLHVYNKLPFKLFRTIICSVVVYRTFLHALASDLYVNIDMFKAILK